jgi:hypothetical protein
MGASNHTCCLELSSLLTSQGLLEATSLCSLCFPNLEATLQYQWFHMCLTQPQGTRPVTVIE